MTFWKVVWALVMASILTSILGVIFLGGSLFTWTYFFSSETTDKPETATDTSAQAA